MDHQLQQTSSGAFSARLIPIMSNLPQATIKTSAAPPRVLVLLPAPFMDDYCKELRACESCVNFILIVMYVSCKGMVEVLHFQKL